MLYTYTNISSTHSGNSLWISPHYNLSTFLIALLGLITRLSGGKQAAPTKRASAGTVVCELQDFIGGDLLGFDLDQWEKDVETHKALALYTPHEGGYEGRYATRLRIQGYYFLDLTARGLGDVESYLSKIHGVRPVSLFSPTVMYVSIINSMCNQRVAK